jgi:hypothetical protein
VLVGLIPATWITLGPPTDKRCPRDETDRSQADEQLGRDAGLLLDRAGTKDAVHASVVAVSATGDRILAGDAGDIRLLVEACGRSIVVPC